MDLFGAKFTIALGAWKLRFVLMLEDDEAVQPAAHAAGAPHHVTARTLSGAQGRRI